FLGYTFGPHRYKKDGHWYLGVSPSKKAVARIKEKVGNLLLPSNTGTWEEVRGRLNQILRGWSAYFSYGTRARRTGRLTTTFMRAYGISCGGVTRCNHAVPTVSASRRCLASWGYCNSAEPRRSLVRESAVKPVGKPDALIGQDRKSTRLNSSHG